MIERMHIQMVPRSYYVITSGVLFLAFIVLTYFVAREYLVQFDFDTTVRLQDNTPARFDPIFSTFSLIGSFEVTGVVFVLLVLTGVRKVRRLATLAIFPLFHIVEILGKTIVDQLPPPFMFHRYALGFHFPSSYLGTDHFSYPSGHAGRTAILVGMMLFLAWRTKRSIWLKLSISGVLVAFLIIMMISRIILGEHWATDVIGGVILGFACATLAGVLW